MSDDVAYLKKKRPFFFLSFFFFSSTAARGTESVGKTEGEREREGGGTGNTYVRTKYINCNFDNCVVSLLTQLHAQATRV